MDVHGYISIRRNSKVNLLKTRYFCIIFVFLALVISGCASSKIKDRVTVLETQDGAFAEQLRNQAEELARLKSSMNTSIEVFENKQAGLSADSQNIRSRIKELQDVNEKQQKEIGTLQTRLSQKDDEIKVLRDRMDQLALKTGYLETYLGLIERDSGDQGRWGNGIARETPKAVSDKYQQYSLAYDLFKDGQYAKARGEFQNFLKNFPNTEYSDNAQFWIGECYFFEGSYEQAILEYDKVRKNYPNGDRVAPALLKKGFSFISLGDKTNGKQILQQVIKDYPRTYQARVAKEKLLELR